MLLAGDRAYKIKKPVDLGFLDFRSAHTRAHVCHRELDLNRRLAPDVYLDVISIAGSDGRSVDHGVLMRRMPEALRLSTMVGQGHDVEGHLRALAELLARFHANAVRGPKIAAEGTATGLRRRWMDNLRETRTFRGACLRGRCTPRSHVSPWITSPAGPGFSPNEPPPGSSSTGTAT